MSTDFVKVREKTHTERLSVHSLSFIITTRLDASTLAYVDAHPPRPRRISRYRGGPELLSFLVEAAHLPLCRPVAAIMTPPSNKQQSLRAQTKGSLRDDRASELHRAGAPFSKKLR